MKVYVYGAGGHGKVVADILFAASREGFAGFVDDAKNPGSSTVLGFPIVGDGPWLQQQASRNTVGVALGLGENCARKRVAEQCLAWGIDLITAIHPRAVVSWSAQVGRGTVVMAGAVINPEAKIGFGVIVNSGAVVEHDVVIADYGHVSPNATMAGAARLGAASQLGAGAVILPGVTVGAATLIGAGAVVVQDLPDSVLAMGVPARVQRRLEENAEKRCLSS